MGKEGTRGSKAGVCVIVLETAGARVAGAERARLDPSGPSSQDWLLPSDMKAHGGADRRARVEAMRPQPPRLADDAEAAEA